MGHIDEVYADHDDGDSSGDGDADDDQDDNDDVDDDDDGSYKDGEWGGRPHGTCLHSAHRLHLFQLQTDDHQCHCHHTEDVVIIITPVPNGDGSSPSLRKGARY